MPSPSVLLRKRLRSFTHAFRGLRTLLVTQPNARLHAVATVAVLATGFFFRLSSAEWSLLILAMMAVWCSEALNTALEFLADATCPEFHPLVQKAKDIAAAAVLCSALGAAILGFLVFLPHFFG